MINEYTRTYKVESEKANILEARIYYSLGGINYFTYKVEPRGYYFSLTPYEVRDGWRSFMAFSGMKMCVLECSRQSKKRYAEAKAMMDALVDEYLEPYCTGNGIELLGDGYTEDERERRVA